MLYNGNTSSHLNTKDKQNYARIVLGWETDWEHLGLLVRVQILMPLSGGCKVLIWPPLVVVKPSYPSQVEHIQGCNEVSKIQRAKMNDNDMTTGFFDRISNEENSEPRKK